jgi:hypothetical protein
VFLLLSWPGEDLLCTFKKFDLVDFTDPFRPKFSAEFFDCNYKKVPFSTVMFTRIFYFLNFLTFQPKIPAETETSSLSQKMLNKAEHVDFTHF